MTAVAAAAPSVAPPLTLRPYQEAAVANAAKALRDHGRTLAAMPTGAGKTIVGLAVAGAIAACRVLVLVHRGELVTQWRDRAALVLPDRRVTTCEAGKVDFGGDIVIGMTQTLMQPATLARLPAFDMLIADEAHHSVAATWQRIVDAVQARNPGCKVLGITATPERADGIGLGRIFGNVSVEIGLDELIDEGHLVTPRALSCSVVETHALDAADRRAGDSEQGEVAALLNTKAVNAQVIERWRETADGRRTIAFTATVQHAHDLAEAFRDAGIAAEAVSGDTPARDRAATLKRLDCGETHIVANAAVLTEGFDCPPVSCIAIARACGSKSALIQMAGRGLRTLDARRYPGEIKTDCVVLDFGGSLRRLGNLLAGTALADRAAPGAKIAGEIGEREAQAGIDAEQELGEMVALDVLRRSAFRWHEMERAGMVAEAIEGAALVIPLRRYFAAVGFDRNGNGEAIRIGTRAQALAGADDWLSRHGSRAAAGKDRAWLTMSPTPAQLDLLRKHGLGVLGRDRYSASTALTWKFKKRAAYAIAFKALGL